MQENFSFKNFYLWNQSITWNMQSYTFVWRVSIFWSYSQTSELRTWESLNTTENSNKNVFYILFI